MACVCFDREAEHRQWVSQFSYIRAEVGVLLRSRHSHTSHGFIAITVSPSRKARDIGYCWYGFEQEHSLCRRRYRFDRKEGHSSVRFHLVNTMSKAEFLWWRRKQSHASHDTSGSEFELPAGRRGTCNIANATSNRNILIVFIVIDLPQRRT
jgi:hypothetical protein